MTAPRPALAVAYRAPADFDDRRAQLSEAVALWERLADSAGDPDERAARFLAAARSPSEATREAAHHALATFIGRR